MDAEHLLNEIQMSTHPQGEVLIHVVDRDHEYWLDITSVERASLGGIPWIDGATIEARPLSSPRAIRPITAPRPYFQPIAGRALQQPEQFTMSRPEHTQDLSEPHYDAARALNRQEVLRALGLQPEMFVDALPIDTARALSPAIQPVVITPEEEED